VQELAEITSDPDAFERFYRQHVEAVQRFVARRVDDPYLPADLTADVFVAVIDSAGSYRPSRGEPVASSSATVSPTRALPACRGRRGRCSSLPAGRRLFYLDVPDGFPVAYASIAVGNDHFTASETSDDLSRTPERLALRLKAHVRVLSLGHHHLPPSCRCRNDVPRNRGALARSSRLRSGLRSDGRGCSRRLHFNARTQLCHDGK
jgi:DNA-directed RNA polymerase specialized sigma24 family protein